MFRDCSWKISCATLCMVLCLVFTLGAPGRAAAQDDTTPIPMISGIEMLKVGAAAPDFTIKDTQGASFSMKQAYSSGKGVLIFFWSIFCEPCKAELPAIQNLIRKYENKGIMFAGVAIDGEPMKEAISAYVKSEGWLFRPLIDELNEDESFKVSDPYGIAGTPTLYVVDTSGVVRFARVGRVPEEEIEAAIKQLL